MMNKFRYFFACALLVGFTTQASAAQWAMVARDKALIFADVEMSSPIGYLKEGQKLRVGQRARNKGRVLPLVYQNKIVYARVVDLEFVAELEANELEYPRIEAMSQERSAETDVGFFGGMYASRFKVDGGNGEASDSKSVITMGLYGQERKAGERASLKLGIEYLKRKDDEEGFNAVLLSVQRAYALLDAGAFTLGVFAGAGLVPWAQLEAVSLYKINGYGLSGAAGLDLKARLRNNWNIHFEGGYQAIKLWGFRLPEELESSDDSLELLLSGPVARFVLTRSF